MSTSPGKGRLTAASSMQMPSYRRTTRPHTLTYAPAPSRPTSLQALRRVRPDGGRGRQAFVGTARRGRCPRDNCFVILAVMCSR